MAQRDAERPGLGGAARLVADRARSIVRLELQLAAAETKAKIAALQVGIGLIVAGAVLGLFGLAFALATVAAALATAVSTWLALLIVAVGLVGLTGVLVLVGVRSIRKGTPPVPEQAIEEAKRVTEALKNGRG